MKSFLAFLLLYICLFINSAYVVPFAADDGPIIETNNGLIQGTIKSTLKGKSYNAFLGIPYAQPPIGELRYKSPVPSANWTGVLNATVDPQDCIQPDFVVPVSFKGVEDCLTLNVYSPVESTGQLPVHVFIHGGGYFEGTIGTGHYGPERLLDTANIIIVYMNYRLGAIGFLSTGDASASGNYGLLDQNLALQWIRDNIAAFGGNPNNVTLTGQSAGSASVHFHILSSKSSGRKERRFVLADEIVYSLANVACFTKPLQRVGRLYVHAWAVEENPLYYAQRLGEKFQCPTDDTAALISCLREQDAGEIAIKGMNIELENLTLAYVPVVENAESGVFLTEDPLTLLQEGRFNKVPLIMGTVRDEGVLIYEFVPFLFQIIDDQFFQEVVPFLLTVLTDYRTNLVNVSYAIKDEYYNIDLTDKDAILRASIDLISDMFMKYWVIETIDLISAQGVPVYMYVYNYVGDFYWTNFTGAADLSHSIELVYLYNMTYETPLTAKDTAFSEKLTPLWTDFVTQGNPTPLGSPQWLPTPTGKTQYFDINDEFTLQEGYEVQHTEFWRITVPAIVNSV